MGGISAIFGLGRRCAPTFSLDSVEARVAPDVQHIEAQEILWQEAPDHIPGGLRVVVRLTEAAGGLSDDPRRQNSVTSELETLIR